MHIQSEITKLFERKHDPRSYHNTLRGLIGKKGNHTIPPLISQDATPITDEDDKATILNEHFASQTRLDTHDRDLPRLDPPSHSFPQLAEAQVTEQEVLQILNTLDVNKSSGPDKIPNKLLKMCALLLAYPLCKLFLAICYPVAKFLPRHILNEIYLTYIRPHFDYCDIIYDGNLTVSDSIRLQTLQNRCARLVTRTLFRTPTNALLNDLGWERLETRRLIHRLLFFHRLYYNYPPLPAYLTNLVTDTRQDATGLQLRNAHLLSLPPIRLTSFRNSYSPATTRQWNLLPETLRNTPRRNFSRQVWRRFGAPDPPTLNTVGTKTLNTQHTRLRVGLTTLNAHLFQFQLTPSPSCSCGHKFEDTAHYILRCPKYTTHRSNLLSAVRPMLRHFDDLSDKHKLDTLLFGRSLSEAQGISIAHHLQTFIAHSRRLNTHTQANSDPTHTQPPR